MKTKLPPAAQQQSREFRDRIEKLRQKLNGAGPKSGVLIFLHTLPPLYDAALSGNVPHTLWAGARFVRALGQIGLVSAQDKAQAQAFLNETMA